MKLPLLATSLALALTTPGFAVPGKVAASAPTAGAHQEAGPAKDLNHPSASLISVPFQANWDFGFAFNIQPVIPISLSEDWNPILRTILPIMNQDGIASLQFGGRHCAEPPMGGSEWGIRATFTLLFREKHTAPEPSSCKK